MVMVADALLSTTIKAQEFHSHFPSPGAQVYNDTSGLLVYFTTSWTYMPELASPSHAQHKYSIRSERVPNTTLHKVCK